MRNLWFIGSSGAVVGAAVAAGWNGFAVAALTIVILVIGRALLLRSAAGRTSPKREHLSTQDEVDGRWGGAPRWARPVSVGVLILAIVASQVLIADRAARADQRGSVVRVVDGDTVDVRIDGVTQRVRLLNIDTPETVDPRKPVECLGPEASAFTRSMLPVGAEVVLQFDGERRDDYGRTLAAVSTSDGRQVSEALAAAGLGTPMDLGHGRFLGPVQAASDLAASNGTGLFDPEVACSGPGTVSTLQAAAVGALAATADAPMAQLEAAAARATGFLRSLETADPTAKGVWRLYSDVQRKGLLSSINGLRDKARALQRGPAVRRAEVARQQAEARAEAARAAVEKKRAEARAAAARLAAQKAAAARAAAAQKAAAKRAAEQRAAEQRAAARRVAAARQATAAREAQRSTGSSSRSGYTGCRAYAPGGKTWKPIPCPGR